MTTMREKTVKKRSVFTGPFFTLREHLVRLPAGEKKRRYILEHPGAVAAVALFPGDRVLLVRQFRKALERETLEIPAGKMERGEKPADTMRRELMEETGYRAGKLKLLVSYYPTLGMSTEIIHVYLARDLRRAKAAARDEAAIDAVLLPRRKVEEMIRTGKIRDSKTIIGLWALRLGKKFNRE
jgi:ADP-ribose pyrophosphatase